LGIVELDKGMPRITSEKPALPTLWVDTAVGIKLAKVQNREIETVEKPRMLRLKELVAALGRNGKLLCPEGEQEYEYLGERLGAAISKEFAALSRGIRLLPRHAVHDKQAFLAMRAYVKGTDIRLPSDIYFHFDPIRRLQEINRDKFFVSVSGLPPVLLGMSSRIKKENFKGWEELRLKNVARKRTYAEQFALEQRAFVNSMVNFSKSFGEKLFKQEVQWWEPLTAQAYEAYFAEWRHLTHKFADWEGLCNFLVSDYFFELPAVKISAQLCAKLATDNRPIEFGDSMDVNHLSMAIPLAHFVLTDRKMANRIKGLEIDRDWGCQVFSESTIDDLFAELEKL
jgi:hypothetical protein